jgi:quercetin dioxygenase-like cupin family protein
VYIRWQNKPLGEEAMPMRATIALLLGLGFPALAAAENARLTILPDQVAWQDFGGGIQLAVLVGDITKREPYVERVRFAPGAEFPLHTHPNTEVVTVLSGAFGSTFDSEDKAKGQILLPGSVLVVPGGTAHFVWAGDEGTVVQVHGMGPDETTLIDPTTGHPKH